jgi:hypothetical protein
MQSRELITQPAARSPQPASRKRILCSIPFSESSILA